MQEDHSALLGARLMLSSSSESTNNGGRDGGPRLKEEDQRDASSEVTQLKEELEVLMKVGAYSSTAEIAIIAFIIYDY